MTEKISRHLYDAVRDVPDFPNPGIVFRDITPILLDPERFREAVDAMMAKVASHPIDKILAIESRGFILAAAMSYALRVGLVPARKAGKLPWHTRRAEYSLEYGTDAIEIHRDAIQSGERVLVVDDLIATGGTAAAACQVASESGGVVLGVCVLIELVMLNGRAKLSEIPLWSVLTYPRE